MLKVMCENGCERGFNLQSPKKINVVSDDIIGQIFAKGNQALKDFSHQFDENNGGTVDTTPTKIDKHAELSVNVCAKSHFCEIGEFSSGSIFGLGEHMDDRIIVAKHTEVQCLLIPHYWLLQKKQNAGNIWQR